MTTTEKLQNVLIAFPLVAIFILCAIIALQIDEIDKLTLEKSELQSKLNIKVVKHYLNRGEYRDKSCK